LNRDWNDFKNLNGNIEGARAAFEVACERIYKKHFNSDEVNKIRSSQGDDGIDILIGDTRKKIIVVQCKFHLEKVEDSQKNQIRNSFNRIIL
jgi:predicted helicase